MIDNNSTIQNFSSHVGTGSSCENELGYDRIGFFTSSVVAGLKLQNTSVNGSDVASVSNPKVKFDLKCLILSLRKVLKLFANVESSSEIGKLIWC